MMTSQTSILSIGSNPNVSFYNWRLFESKLCDLTVITNTQTQLSNQFQFSSSAFGNSRYTISRVFNNLANFQKQRVSNNFDFIFISATSLQEITSVCAQLTPILQRSIENGVVPTIVVESTDYVNLEVTVQKCLQINANIEVLAIMTDFDVRSLSQNSFKLMDSKKESELVYIGKGHYENTKYTSSQVTLINKLGNLLENIGLDVYKLATPLEFLSYQWKFALPQIVLGPLSIIFEQPFPESLYDYLLAKPLISGLILEIISVIRTMNCKLFKGYDNENSLIQRCIQLDPKKPNQSGNFLEAPKLFYNFYNQNELYLDLLLLQPIFLADDFQIKTPYLEFLYAILTKCNDNNGSTPENNKSMFWLRKNDANIQSYKLKEQENTKQNAKLLQESQRQLQAAAVAPAPIPMQNATGSTGSIPTQAINGNGYVENGYAVQPPVQQPQQQAPQQAQMPPQQQPPQQQQQAETPQMNDNLDDLTDIAVYGAQLNGESFSPQADEQVNRDVQMTGQGMGGGQSVPMQGAPQQQPVPNNIYAQQAYQKQMSRSQQALVAPGPQQPQYNNYNGAVMNGHSIPPNAVPVMQHQSSSPTAPNQPVFQPQVQPQQPYYGQAQPQPQGRRMSTMPSYQSQQFLPQGPPKPTSRKNRKSAFPGTMMQATAGVDFGGHGGMPGVKRPVMANGAGSSQRLKHQSSYNMMNGRGGGATSSVYGMNQLMQPQAQVPPQQQQQQFYAPQAQQPQYAAQQQQQQPQQHAHTQSRQLSVADLSTSTVLQQPNGSATQFQQPPQQQVSSASAFNGGAGSRNVSSDDLNSGQHLEPAPQIVPEQKSAPIHSFTTTDASLNGSSGNLGDSKPLGVTSDTNGVDKAKQKKKKGFFGRKK